MRTPEQISNVRRALSRTPYGVYSLLMNDEEMDAFLDRLQIDVDNLKHFFSIKVKTKENEKEAWTKIKYEEKAPFSTFTLVDLKCKELLNKFPELLEIRLCAMEDGRELGEPYFYTRK